MGWKIVKGQSVALNFLQIRSTTWVMPWLSYCTWWLGVCIYCKTSFGICTFNMGVEWQNSARWTTSCYVDKLIGKVNPTIYSYPDMFRFPWSFSCESQCAKCETRLCQRLPDRWDFFEIPHAGQNGLLWTGRLLVFHRDLVLFCIGCTYPQGTITYPTLKVAGKITFPLPLRWDMLVPRKGVLMYTVLSIIMCFFLWYDILPHPTKKRPPTTSPSSGVVSAVTFSTLSSTAGGSSSTPRRIWLKDISMHTFDNGLKAATKNDNWEQLFRPRFFEKCRWGLGWGFLWLVRSMGMGFDVVFFNLKR